MFGNIVREFTRNPTAKLMLEKIFNQKVIRLDGNGKLWSEFFNALRKGRWW